MMKRSVLPLLFALGAGASCGPIRTPGTEGKDSSELAVVRIPRHTGAKSSDGKKSHVTNVFFGGPTQSQEKDPITRAVSAREGGYEISGRGDSFYLLPGKYVVTVDYENCNHGSWSCFPGLSRLFSHPHPMGLATFTAEGDKTYVLKCRKKTFYMGSIAPLSSPHDLEEVK